jgi:hypothetical protein
LSVNYLSFSKTRIADWPLPEKKDR